MNYTLAKGKLFFDAFDTNGVLTGERYLGNTPGADLTIDSTVLDHYSSESGISEKDMSLVTQIDRKLVITCDDISLENQAMFIIGGVSTLTQVAGPVVAEAIGPVLQDRYYQLGASAGNITGVRNVSAVAVKNGATTYVAGTDYVLDALQARLYIVPGGAIVDATTLAVDYTKAAAVRQQIATSSLEIKSGALRFVADNPRGANRDLYAPKVNLKPNGSMTLKGEKAEWAKLQFDVEFLKRDADTAALYLDGRPA